MRTFFNWMGLIGGVLVGGLFALTGNILAGAGVGLGFAVFCIGAGLIGARGNDRLAAIWTGLFFAVTGGLIVGFDGAPILASAGYSLAVGVSVCLGMIWVLRLGPVDRDAIASLSGAQRRRQLRLRRIGFVNMVLAFVPMYILAVVRHRPRYAAEWAFLGLILVWSLGHGLQVLIVGSSTASTTGTG